MIESRPDEEAPTTTPERERDLLEQELAAMERPPPGSQLRWTWLLVIAGLLAAIGLSIHGYSAYSTIDRLNVNAKIDTPNPVLLLQDIATNGPRVGNTVEASQRATYTRALEQFVLDGTGVLVGLLLALGGLFVRINQ